VRELVLLAAGTAIRQGRRLRASVSAFSAASAFVLPLAADLQAEALPPPDWDRLSSMPESRSRRECE
jgi:hypothetical protein